MIYSASTGFPEPPSIGIPPVEQPSESGRQNVSAHEGPMARLMRISSANDVSQATLEDWQCMLSALTERLSSNVAMPADRSLPSLTKATRRLQDVVMEWAGDLDRLHAAMSSEDERRRQLEVDAIASSAAVLQALGCSVTPPRRA